ncbi:hypothetical protein N665_0470s0012 [Sinapis alba]|nr:hypothetical protein N665_0470s0012 [Sinapis alba]
MKNVMVIIDESNSSYDLLIWVLTNLKDIIDSSKLVIFAKQPQNSFTPPTTLSTSVGFAQIFYPFSAKLMRLAQEKNTKIALGILEKAKKLCGNHGVKAETFTDVGDLKDTIHKIIQERKINLIAISDQQNQNLKKCLPTTECSLVVVKQGFPKHL